MMDSQTQSNANRLLVEALAGHNESLGALLEVYRKYLYLLARTQMGFHVQGRVNPSDLVQETFLLACRHFTQFRGQTTKELLGWLRRILVHNLARLAEKQVQAQKRSVRREVSLEQNHGKAGKTSEPLVLSLVSPGSSPSTQAQRHEVAAIVADQLAQLPVAYRDVLILRNLEGLSFEEVGRRMGRSTGAVRVLWLRALDQLRRQHGGKDVV